MTATTTDLEWMRVALAEAQQAARLGEVPIGAVVVFDGRVLARAHNRRETDQDPLAHAEILALRQAAREIGSWRLLGCSLYVTLEPCAMCAGAVVNSRVDRVVFGPRDPKAGYCGSLGDIVGDARLNHLPQVVEGVLADESAELLKDFFRQLRRSRKEGLVP